VQLQRPESRNPNKRRARGGSFQRPIGDRRVFLTKRYPRFQGGRQQTDDRCQNAWQSSKQCMTRLPMARSSSRYGVA
jgi:hypothetical protein